MKLIYVFHSCFIIEGTSANVIIDYYRDAQDLPVQQVIDHIDKPLYVLSSHIHFDHFNPEILKWKDIHPNIHYILSSDIQSKKINDSPTITWLNKGDTYKDNIISIEAFGSTDAGISFYFEMEDKKIFHAGDLNNWHWNEESTTEEVKKAEDWYLRELNDVAKVVQKPDIAMFPVDPRLGKDLCKGALQFMDAVHPHLLVPMHFGEDIGNVPQIQGFAHWTHENESIIF